MTEYEPPELKTTLIATGIALLLALVVLFVAVLPAEYGIDPTGIGGAMGLTALQAEPESKEPNVTIEGETIKRFNATWPVAQALVLDDEGTSTTGESTTVDLNIEARNVTRLTATLSWDDEAVGGQQTEPDTFHVVITAPDGESREWTGRNEGPSETLTMPFVIGKAPAATVVDATSEGAARGLLIDRFPATTDARGNWSIEITLREAGGLGPITDEGNDWTLRVFASTYQLALGEGVETGEREDTFTITVPAGDGVEYKVFVSEGNSFSYDWSAPRAVYYDFHGVKGTGEEVSHETGTAAQVDGHFISPFHGRHGWYWQNDGVTELEVTLVLQGTYQVVQ